jgi:phenylacetate-coenzyme A ligase PaaK-like adenylate-forming protein
VKQGEDAKVRILKEAEAAAEKLKEQASKNIEHEFLQAKAELQGGNRGKGPGQGRGDHQGKDQFGRPGQTGG